MTKALSILTILTGLFPFSTIVSFGTDIQPWNVILLVTMAIIFFFRDRFNNINPNLFILFIPMFLALILITISTNNLFAYTRSLLGYITIALSPIVYFYIISINFNRFVKILKISTYIWLSVALIQYFIDVSFFETILNRISTTESRGITSLSPEPTFYGIIGIFFILIFLTINDKQKKWYIFLWICQIFLLAQSSMAILFIIIFTFYLIVFRINMKIFFYLMLLIISLFFVLFFINLSNDLNIRVVTLITLFWDVGFDIANIDGSVNDRLSAIYFSILGTINNGFLPNGMGNYTSYLHEELLKYGYFWYVGITDRIMSYYGSALFELGIIGALIPLVYSKIIIRAFAGRKRDMLLYLMFLNTILFTTIQLSLSLIGMYIAVLLYNISQKPHYSKIENSIIKTKRVAYE